MILALLYLYSYLVGAVPTAYILGRVIKGIDIRKYGSGNVGAANVYTHVGKKWIFPLGLFELLLKGASPVWLGIVLLDIDVKDSTGVYALDFLFGFNRESAALAGASLLSIAGNNWSVFLKFQGGRGLAAASGALGVMAFYQLLIFIVLSLTGWLYFKISAAVITLIILLSLPLWTLLLGQSSTVVWYCVGVVVLIALKRVMANGMPPEGVLSRRVFFNRLLLDRDVASRKLWIHRLPETEKDLR